MAKGLLNTHESGRIIVGRPFASCEEGDRPEETGPVRTHEVAMRMILKLILKVLFLFVLAFGLTLVYLKWTGRDDPAGTPLSSEEISGARAAVEQFEIEARRGEVRLTAADLREILMASLATSKSGRTVLENSTDVQASVVDGRIEAGVVLATTGLSERLEGSGDRNLERLAKVLEFMPGDGVFVGARGLPVVRDGQLGIDTSTLELRIGPLDVSPEELADRIGLSSDKIAEELLLGIEGVVFQSVRVDGKTLLIETRAE